MFWLSVYLFCLSVCVSLLSIFLFVLSVYLFYLSICFVCLSVCLSAFLPICLSVRSACSVLSTSLSICLSNGHVRLSCRPEFCLSASYCLFFPFSFFSLLSFIAVRSCPVLCQCSVRFPVSFFFLIPKKETKTVMERKRRRWKKERWHLVWQMDQTSRSRSVRESHNDGR